MDNIKSIFKSFMWSVKEISRHNKWIMWVLLVATLLSGLIPPATVLLTQEIVNSIQLHKTMNIILYLIISYLLLSFINDVTSSYINYYTTKSGLNFDLHINKKILDKTEKLPLSSYENSETYNIINRAQSESNGKILAYLKNVFSIFSNIISTISFIIIIINLNAWLMVAILIIPLIKFIIINMINIEAFKIIKKRTNDSRKTWYVQFILTYGSFYKELKIYDLFNFFIDKYSTLQEKFNCQDIKLQKKQMIQLTAVTTIETIIDGMILLFIISLGYSGKILIGSVMTNINAVSQIKTRITSILQMISKLNQDSLFIDQLILYLNLEEEEEDSKKIEINEIEQIEIKNLSFRYPDNEDLSLCNINLKMKKNDKIAIVGMNGSGKSTLIKIILGFYKDYSGEVLINNINLRDINKHSLLKNVSSVFQDYAKYEATFLENISYGDINKKVILDELDEISHSFSLSKVINSSKDRYDTQIGNWFDNGIQISEGEWQKIALARASFKDSSFYILDEPNASLDAISDKKLSEMYKKMAQKNITIIIAHKFSSFIKDVNQIVVLDKGKICGVGKHEELFHSCPIYKKLYSLQVA